MIPAPSCTPSKWVLHQHPDEDVEAAGDVLVGRRRGVHAVWQRGRVQAPLIGQHMVLAVHELHIVILAGKVAVSKRCRVGVGEGGLVV